MPESIDIGYAIKLPPRRAIAYFKSKGYNISWNWWETWQVANAQSFTVAKALRADILGDIRDSFDQALRKGYTPDKFIKELEPVLRAKGWWGKQVIVSQDGGAEIVQLGSPHRLRTIYNVNARTSRARAHYQVQQATLAERPYWMYDAMDDLRVRPHHAAMDGLVFRADDPIWQTHYPPNGFNCRCRVRALSQEELEQRDLKVSNSRDRLKEIEQQVGVDKRSGEVISKPATQYTTPSGTTMTPDPGWNYNPGDPEASQGGDRDGGGKKMVEEFIPAENQTTWRESGRPPATQLPFNPGIPPVVQGPSNPLLERRQRIYDATETPGFKQYVITRADGKKDIIYNEVETPDGLDNVLLSESFVSHIAIKETRDRDQFSRYVLPTLQNPAEVWRQWTKKDGRVVQRTKYLARFSDSEYGYVVVEDLPKTAAVSWTFFPITNLRYVENHRSGILLYQSGGN